MKSLKLNNSILIKHVFHLKYFLKVKNLFILFLNILLIFQKIGLKMNCHNITENLKKINKCRNNCEKTKNRKKL
jgi:hypothetical protein